MLGFNTERKRVALVGSAPSSVRLAPYGKEDWFVVGCSPGAYPHAGPKANAWMELHRWEPQVAGQAGTGQSWFSPEYCEFLTRFKGEVYMLAPLPPEVPNGTLVEYMRLMDEFGPYFFTSSLSWMFAMAILTPGVEEIGLWGVDMAANEEYQWQRPGCQFFIQQAMERGITVTVPPESDLLQPSLWYGVCENDPMYIKGQERKRELEARLAAADQRARAASDEGHFIRGALDNMNYITSTWVTSNRFLKPTMGETGNEVRVTAAWDKNKPVDPLPERRSPDRSPCAAGIKVEEPTIIHPACIPEDMESEKVG